jgi:hypothetical protein
MVFRLHVNDRDSFHVQRIGHQEREARNQGVGIRCFQRLLPDGGHQGVVARANEGLAGTQGFGDVPDRSEEAQTLRAVQWTQCDFDWKLRSVVPLAYQGHAAASHWPYPWSRHVRRAMRAVARADVLRHQCFDIKTVQGPRRVTEQVLRLPVGQQDATGFIDHHQRIRHIVEQLRQHAADLRRVSPRPRPCTPPHVRT